MWILLYKIFSAERNIYFIEYTTSLTEAFRKVWPQFIKACLVIAYKNTSSVQRGKIMKSANLFDCSSNCTI